jgi:hypothetical protein
MAENIITTDNNSIEIADKSNMLRETELVGINLPDERLWITVVRDASGNIVIHTGKLVDTEHFGLQNIAGMLGRAYVDSTGAIVV